MLAAATFTLVTASAAAAVPVTVEATLERIPGGAVVTGQIVWNGTAAEADDMSVGDLRLLAIRQRDHHPTLLATGRHVGISKSDATQRVDLVINRRDLYAIRRGNRVVLTASQHRILGGTYTPKTYVTVGQLQPFGSPQGRIGSRNCSDKAIAPGEDLNKCDLVGAFLDGASVSNKPKATRMRAADLTGATMKGANLTELSVAGGRLNGADLTNATIVKLFLPGAEATGLIASKAKSPTETEGANFFDARLTGADFSDAVLKGVSLNHARLDGADLQRVTWQGRDAKTASFRGANLSGSTGTIPSVDFSDFSGADLQDTTLTDDNLAWATLCGTVMPNGTKSNPNRDCRASIDPGPAPAAKPYVKIDGASLVRRGDQAEIQATVHWNDDRTSSFKMSAGDVRAVAINGSTGVPTALGEPRRIRGDLPAETSYTTTITKGDELAALRAGNRVVVTATQHPQLPGGGRTDRSYVTVYMLQPGPGRGRVGSRDCSDMALTAPAPAPRAPAPQGYDFCDLPGAALTQAQLAGPMRDADLTGAELNGAGLSNIKFDGAAMGGVVATGARFNGVSMLEAFAPDLRMETRATVIDHAELRARSLEGANFSGARISETSFAAAPMRGATFSNAKFDHVDLAYARLRRAKLDHVVANDKRFLGSTLFLADLTRATLEGKDSDWADNEEGQRPWEWATLCLTTMPTQDTPRAVASGDRDCRRPR